MENLRKNSSQPFVSVIMPVRNEGEFIERGLRAIFSQTYPDDLLEIIIADGQSTDHTRRMIESLKDETQIPITVIDNPQRIAPTGLNLAVANARGEIIIRVDGHCEIEPDYVANCVKYLRTGRAEGVGGPIETIGENTIARAIALAMSSTFGVGGSAFRTVKDKEIYVDTVAFPGYTKEVLEKTGLFNEELVRNQDDEYNYRIRKMGGRILLSPDIRSRYFSRSTLRSLWRQYFQYGYWKVRVLQMHPKQMSLRQFVPFVFVTALLLSAFSAIFFAAGRWAFLMILFSYLLANLVSAVLTAGSKIYLIPILSLSFAILHVSYGLGSLAGLVSFRNKWREKEENR